MRNDAGNSDSLQLSSETQGLSLCPLNSLNAFATPNPAKPTRAPNASRGPHDVSNCRMNPLGFNCKYIKIPYGIHGCPACFGLSSPTQCWSRPVNNVARNPTEYWTCRSLFAAVHNGSTASLRKGAAPRDASQRRATPRRVLATRTSRTRYAQV